MNDNENFFDKENINNQKQFWLSITAIIIFILIFAIAINMYFDYLTQELDSGGKPVRLNVYSTDMPCRTKEEKKLILKEEAIDEIYSGHFINAFKKYRAIDKAQDDRIQSTSFQIPKQYRAVEPVCWVIKKR